MRFLAKVCALGLALWVGVGHAQSALDADLAAWPKNAMQLAHLVVSRADHGRRPFAVVDKGAAQILVFDAEGRLVGRSAALLGSAVGDASAAGVGQRTQQGRLRSSDRTTPAGLFQAETGRNLSGETIVWVDYGSAFAIHRLRPGPDHDSRSRRLDSDDPLARRVSAGCVVVPGAFYDTVVQPLLGHQRGQVYVMPEPAPARLVTAAAGV